MPDLNLDLARALVAVPGFRLMLGMIVRCHRERFLVTGFNDRGPILALVQTDLADDVGSWRLPDLNAPATAGCLAELLGPGVVRLSADGTTRAWSIDGPDGTGSTRGEAIARAVVAAGRCAGGGG